MKAALFALVSAVLFLQPATAQYRAEAPVQIAVPHFARVVADREVIQFTVSPDAVVEHTIQVVYETNGDGHRLAAHVEGDLTGLEVQVEPLAAQVEVLGQGTSGTIGAPLPLVFRESGSKVLVAGIGYAGAALPVRYRITASGNRPIRDRTLRIYYTMQ